jgi:hypothetical protein
MPSVVIGGQSGGVPLWSGCLFSGILPRNPTGGILIRSDRASSGSCYLGFSGGVTLNSGGGMFSGGFRDGLDIGPREACFLPNTLLANQFMSGATLWATTALSGWVRLHIVPDMPTMAVN